MTELEYLQDVAEALKKFLLEYQKLANVKLGGTSCCGCGNITLEVMPLTPDVDFRACVDVMELES